MKVFVVSFCFQFLTNNKLLTINQDAEEISFSNVSFLYFSSSRIYSSDYFKDNVRMSIIYWYFGTLFFRSLYYP